MLWILMMACSPSGCGVAEVADVDEDVCGEGELLDRGVCVPEECGLGPWGNLEGGDDAVWVLAGAEGGDGTKERPLGSIQAGIDQVEGNGGGRVLVGEGTYGEQLIIDVKFALSVEGRCSAASTVSVGESADVGSVRLGGLPGRRVAFSGVTVRGGVGGVWVKGGDVELQDVAIVGTRFFGLLVAQMGTVNTTAALRHVRVADVSNEEDFVEEVGAGIMVYPGVEVELEDVSVTGAMGFGIGIHAAEARLEDVKIADVTEGSLGIGAGGLVITDGALVTGRGVHVEDVANTGVWVFGQSPEMPVPPGPSVFDIQDLEIRGVHVLEFYHQYERAKGVHVSCGGAMYAADLEVSGVEGIAAGVSGTCSEEALLEMSDYLIEHDASAIWVYGPDAVMDARGGTIKNIGGGGDEEDVYRIAALMVFDGASAEFDELSVEDVFFAGMIVTDDATELTMSRVSVVGVEPGFGGEGGRGLHAQDRSVVNLFDVSVSDVQDVGVAVHIGADVSADGLYVEDVHRLPGQLASVGVAVQRSSSFSGRDVQISGVEGPGAVVLSGSEFACRDLRVADVEGVGFFVQGASATLTGAGELGGVEPSPDDGGGVGVFVVDSSVGLAEVSLEGVRVYGTQAAAVVVQSAGLVSIQDSLIDAAAGVPTGSGRERFGYGLVVVDGGPRQAADGGVHLYEPTEVRGGQVGVLLHGSTADLGSVTVSGSQIAVVQQDCDGVEEAAGLEDCLDCEICTLSYNHEIPDYFPTLYLRDLDVGLE
ncbi:MAG: hypothetical protein H6739_18030 [Alphaproteobacteria bacterium]|nr:hypothetical protein [Alphaproteobacteria bacterium]